MKKIALSVLAASTFALAACGGAAPANNAAAETQNTIDNAIEQINAANAEGQNLANAATSAATNELHAATSELNAATANLANAAAAH